MDITTIAGILLGFGAMIVAILVEGKGDITELVPFFINMSAWIIIIVGTIGATMLSSKMSDFVRIPKILGKMFREDKYDFIGIIDTITSLADKARREGLIALESDLGEIQNPMLQKGLQLVIDGIEIEQIEGILQTNLVQKKNEAAGDATVFENLGGFSPTMGIIGTVMGLVGALKRMGSAGMENTVAALAVAFIATFWGIGLANLLWLPLCNKIRSRWRDELILNQIIIEGVMAIQSGNNPRIVRERLLSFLSLEDAAAAEQSEAAAKA